MKTRRRWFIGISAALLLALLYTGEKIFFIGLAVILSLMAYAALTSLWVLLDFNYLQRVSPPNPTKGSTALLEIEIHNDKPFIFPYIKIFYQTLESNMTGSPKEAIFSILPFQHQAIKEEISCNVRGQFWLGITRVEVRDLFGLFTFSTNMLDKPYHKRLEINVWPRVLTLPYLPLPQVQQEGALNRKLVGTEELATVSDIRQYRFGDPLKKIHWKISSKLQEIQVKNYETSTQPETLLFVETIPYPDEGILRYHIEDQIIECTTAIAHYILSKWLPLQLVTYHRERQEVNGKNPQDFQRFFNFLGLLPFNSPFSMAEILNMELAGISRDGNLVVVIHQLDSKLFNFLCLLQQSGINPMVFCIKPRDTIRRENKKMIDDLNEKGIPSYLVYTDSRLDQLLETVL